MLRQVLAPPVHVVIAQEATVDRVESSTIIDQARRAAAGLVDREAAIVGSKMAAYERVAQMSGASPEWLRKFVGNYPEAKQPSFVVGCNLLLLYARMQRP